MKGTRSSVSLHATALVLLAGKLLPVGGKGGASQNSNIDDSHSHSRHDACNAINHSQTQAT